MQNYVALKVFEEIKNEANKKNANVHLLVGQKKWLRYYL